MKWTITLLAILFTTIACRKTAIDENQAVAASSDEITSIVGTWNMIQYFTDPGDGHGIWMDADPQNTETISFYADGTFKASSNSPMYVFTSYKLKDSTITFYSPSGFVDNYPYSFESATQILIKPHCRESCMRRYKLVDQGK